MLRKDTCLKYQVVHLSRGKAMCAQPFIRESQAYLVQQELGLRSAEHHIRLDLIFFSLVVREKVRGFLSDVLQSPYKIAGHKAQACVRQYDFAKN